MGALREQHVTDVALVFVFFSPPPLPPSPTTTTTRYLFGTRERRNLSLSTRGKKDSQTPMWRSDCFPSDHGKYKLFLTFCEIPRITDPSRFSLRRVKRKCHDHFHLVSVGLHKEQASEYFRTHRLMIFFFYFFYVISIRAQLQQLFSIIKCHQ